MIAPSPRIASQVLALSAPFAFSLAFSQSGDNELEAGAQNIEIEEIVVSATRRETLLQTTPISIGVLTEQTIEDAGVWHLFDYWRMVPSLAMTDRGFAGTRTSIRGLSGSSVNEADESMVANYIDDTFLPAPQKLFSFAPSLRTVDMQRIEVLRGPQGTLFGSGAMGGAIRMITNKPDPSNSFQVYDTYISSTAHGGMNYGVTAVFNIPIKEDLSAIRLAVYHFDDDGFIDDVGSGEKNANSNAATGIRLSGVSILTDKLTIAGKILFESSELDSFAYVDPNGKPQVGIPITSDYQNALMVDDYRNEETFIASFDLNYEFSIGNFTSVTSYVDSSTDLALDLSDEMGSIFGTFFPATAGGPDSQSTFEQEFRLASNSDKRLSWQFGFFFADINLSDKPIIEAPGVNAICGGCTGLPDGEETLLVGNNEDHRREIGLFTDLTYRFTEKFEANFGVRYYDLSRTSVERSTGIFSNPNSPVSTRELQDDGFNGKAGLTYYATDALMFYASVAQGFRPGGINELNAAAACNQPQTFDSDSLVNYELGAKTRYLDDRLTLNGSIFHIKWDDAQLLVQPQCIFSVAINSGGVTVDGLEFESTFVASERWDFTLNLAYNNPTIDNDIPDHGAPAGQILSYVPDVTGNFAATFHFNSFSSTDGFARLDYQYVADSYSNIGDLGAQPRVLQPSYSLVNFRIGTETDRWRVTLFADNVFDEKAVSRCCRANGEYTIIKPRTIGVRARLNVN